MPKYVVKPKVRFGFDERYGPGDIVELTEFEAGGFLDKLKLVKDAPKPAQDTFLEEQPTSEIPKSEPEPEPEAFDISGLSVDAVLSAVAAGAISTRDALDAEQNGKKRVTLLRELGKQLNG